MAPPEPTDQSQGAIDTGGKTHAEVNGCTHPELFKVSPLEELPIPPRNGVKKCGTNTHNRMSNPLA